MILQCSHIDKAFSTDVILSDISFHINEHEKAAIVGANGSGKSTLLKIITGHLSADNGEVILSGSTTVGYLAQNQEYASEHSIYDEMRDAKPEIIQLEQQMILKPAKLWSKSSNSMTMQDNATSVSTDTPTKASWWVS